MSSLFRFGLPLLVALSLLTGCVYHIQSREGLSDDFVRTLKVNNRDRLAYSFSSALQQTHQILDVNLPANRVFEARLKDYLGQRFNHLSQGQADYQLTLRIETLNINMNYNPDFASAIANAQSADPVVGNGSTQAALVLHVLVQKQGQTLGEKRIEATTNAGFDVRKSDTYRYKEVAFTRAFDQVVNRSIESLDRYLLSLEL